MSESALRLRGVRATLGERAILDGIDLEVDAGERVSLVGPSGAGKTSLLRLFNGTLAPSAGTVEVEGRDLAALSTGELRELRTGIGFVPQDHGLVPNLRVSQNVAAGRLGQRGFLEGARSMLATRDEDLEEIHALLERVGIADRLFERTDRLSGGEQQRVAIARALFQRPRFFFADEPVASVDPARARDIVALLTELATEYELTLVTSLHDLGLARDHFPRVVGMRTGRVALDEAPSALDEAAFAELYEL